MALTTHPYLATRSKKEYSFTSTPFLGLNCLFYCDLYLYTFTSERRVTSTRAVGSWTQIQSRSGRFEGREISYILHRVH